MSCHRLQPERDYRVAFINTDDAQVAGLMGITPSLVV
jgi:hypothetical protein